MPYVVAAAVAGPSHRIDEGCQDRIAYEADCCHAAISVADGLGSAPLGALGAEIAVSKAIRSAGMFSCTEVVRQARQSLEIEATKRSTDIRNLACTLIVCAVQEGTIEIGHVGDGGVVARAGNDLYLLSSPGDSEYSNEVDHLASDDWEETVRISSLELDVECLAVFTDGCQRAALIKDLEGYHPHPGFFDPIFDWAIAARDLEQASAELEALLRGEKMAEHSEDDKTLAITVFPANDHV